MRSNRTSTELFDMGYRACPPVKCPYGLLATCSTCMHAVYPKEVSEVDEYGLPILSSMEDNDNKFCTYKKVGNF